jgi:hypothetical protein
MPGKWNKNCKDAWRMDVDIAIGDSFDDDSNVEDESEDQDDDFKDDNDIEIESCDEESIDSDDE